jgi:hypothetical protein
MVSELNSQIFFWTTESFINDLEYACYENYAVVGVSFSQYIFLALAYSKKCF